MFPRRCSGAGPIKSGPPLRFFLSLPILLCAAMLPAGTSYYESDYHASFKVAYTLAVKGERAAAFIPLPITFQGSGNSQTLRDFKCVFAVDPCEQQLLFSPETGRVCMFSWEYLEKACEIRIEYTIELKAASRVTVKQTLPLTKDHLDKSLWGQMQKRRKQYQKSKVLRRDSNRLRSGIRSQVVLVERVCNWISDNNHRAYAKNVNKSQEDSYVRADIGRIMLTLMGIPANVVPVSGLPNNQPYYLMEVFYPDTGWLLYDMGGHMRHAVPRAFQFGGNPAGIWVEQDGLWEQLQPEISVKQISGPPAGSPPQAKHALLTPRAKVFSARIETAGKSVSGLRQSLNTCYRQFSDGESRQFAGKQEPARLYVCTQKDRAGREQKSHGRLKTIDIVFKGQPAVLLREQWFYALSTLKPEPLRMRENLAVFSRAGALLRADVYDRFAQVSFRKAYPERGWKQSLEVTDTIAELITKGGGKQRLEFDDPIPALAAGHVLLMPARISRQLVLDLDGYFIFPDLPHRNKITGSFTHQNDEPLKDPESRTFTAHKMGYGPQQFLWLNAEGVIVRQQNGARIITWEPPSRIASLARELRGRTAGNVQEYKVRKK